jgi:esterase/lipase
MHPKISICGLSLGGMISVAAMAWEKRIEKGTLIQCGGNWDTIYWNSLVRILMHGCFIDREKIKREQAREFYLPIHEFIKKYKSIDPENIDYELSEYSTLSSYRQKTWFLSDPLTFAHKINPKNVIMINAKFDILFCRDSTLQLWNELGKPKIYWFNDIHTSAVLNNKKVLKLIFNFL